MTDTIETIVDAEDAVDVPVAVKFLGAPADQPFRGVLNGCQFEYAIGVAVLALTSHLVIADDAGFQYELLGDDETARLVAQHEELSQPEPEGEGAPLGSDPAQGDGGGSASGGAAAAVDLSLLDGNVEQVTAQLAGLDAASLAALLEAEQNGKTRKTVLDAIQAALAA